ncbi:MAG: TVP38/TMEM64 family protein [Deltaproteobacteria bacterium]|nr:TVP38/TMEM64 family protein [Deltaproteobacteria bacterium]
MRVPAVEPAPEPAPEESPPPERSRRRRLKRLFLAALLCAAALGARAAGLTHYVDPERLRAAIAGAGAWAPAAYVLVYAVAPALFVPGLPLTLAGGILFGPFWGVVYAITGATSGACLAFLFSRYVAREWVEARLARSRWRSLDEEVARRGWKVVAFTRLVPLIPFNLLNYALGLTKIGFVPYALATFFGMLPACVAYVVFSSSLLDLLRGRISAALLWGALVAALLSLLPFVLRRLSARSKRG